MQKKVESVGVFQQVETHLMSSGLFKVAKELKMKTIGLTGNNGGKMREFSDILINVIQLLEFKSYIYRFIIIFVSK